MAVWSDWIAMSPTWYGCARSTHERADARSPTLRNAAARRHTCAHTGHASRLGPGVTSARAGFLLSARQQSRQRFGWRPLSLTALPGSQLLHNPHDTVQLRHADLTHRRPVVADGSHQSQPGR